MLLNVDTVVNDSKKISELRKLSKATKHQENTWIPMSQYNSRTNTYTNAAINLQAITSYNISYSYSYLAGEFGHDWIDLLSIGKSEGTENIDNAIHNSIIANNILSYTFTYTIRHLDWQIVKGTYVPDYYIPRHPDDVDQTRTTMELPNYSTLFKNNMTEENEENILEENDING